MKKIIFFLTFTLSIGAYSNGGSVGGPGPKPIKDAMVLEFINDYGDLEEYEVDLSDISEILTRDDLILTRRNLIELDIRNLEPAEILFNNGELLRLR